MKIQKDLWNYWSKNRQALFDGQNNEQPMGATLYRQCNYETLAVFLPFLVLSLTAMVIMSITARMCSVI